MVILALGVCIWKAYLEIVIWKGGEKKCDHAASALECSFFMIICGGLDSLLWMTFQMKGDTVKGLWGFLTRLSVLYCKHGSWTTE